MSVLVKIRAMSNSLTSSEAKIAEFALNSPAAIKQLSSQKLGHTVGVSQSSIVKFAQKLGYKGYPDFKMALIEADSEEESTALLGEIALSDDLSLLNMKLLASKTKVLTDTASLNDTQTMEQAVNLLLSAKRILVSGIGASGLVAKDFSFKLQKIGKFALAELVGHIQLAYVATFTEGDLLFCLSESGNSEEVVATAAHAKQLGCQVISVTSYTENELAKIADVNLYSVAEKESQRLSSILSRTSQEYVIDMLFLALTQHSRRSRKMIEKSNQAVNTYLKKTRT